MARLRAQSVVCAVWTYLLHCRSEAQFGFSPLSSLSFLFSFLSLSSFIALSTAKLSLSLSLYSLLSSLHPFPSSRFLTLSIFSLPVFTHTHTHTHSLFSPLLNTLNKAVEIAREIDTEEKEKEKERVGK